MKYRNNSKQKQTAIKNSLPTIVAPGQTIDLSDRDLKVMGFNAYHFDKVQGEEDAKEVAEDVVETETIEDGKDGKDEGGKPEAGAEGDKVAEEAAAKAKAESIKAATAKVAEAEKTEAELAEDATAADKKAAKAAVTAAKKELEKVSK